MIVTLAYCASSAKDDVVGGSLLVLVSGHCKMIGDCGNGFYGDVSIN
jgi:hypothetical protein